MGQLKGDGAHREQDMAVSLVWRWCWATVVVVVLVMITCTCTCTGQTPDADADPQPAPTPVVLWHGLGDAFDDAGMARLAGLLGEALPQGTFVHSVRVGSDTAEDRKLGLLDNADRQVAQVCAQLRRMPELRQGFHAVGFSQGGLLLRAYVQRCNDPPVRRLITLGSPHWGVEAIPGCSALRPAPAAPAPWYQETVFARVLRFLGALFRDSPEDTPECRWWMRLLQRGAYSALARHRVMPAQYFRDPFQLAPYHAHNTFLQDLNAEWLDPRLRNPVYPRRLLQLDALYLYRFSAEQVLVPRESSWFGLSDAQVLPVPTWPQDEPFWAHDLLGLKALHRSNRLFFRSLPGSHMQISEAFIFDELAPLLQ